MRVPCGHCLQCLKRYQDAWTARLSEELRSWKSVDGNVPVVFFTLDYNNDAIPCTYAVLTEFGYRLTSVRPNCPVREFWTDTRRESRSEWLRRRRSMLTEYWQTMEYIWSTVERNAEVEDIINGNYEYKPDCFHPQFACDLPEFDVPFFSFSDGGLDHPCYSKDHVMIDASGYPLDSVRCYVAFEFHSVSKSDVTGWIKRGREAARYDCPELFDQEVSPRFESRWTDSEGVEHLLPSCSIPRNFKYFITSEYGPKTNRPHYHGVMFGCTIDEFEKYFAEDWRCRFGHVVCDALHPSGGAMLYVSKYCAKGEYEHPYCKRDYFYSSSEFHSRDFEDCILDFGINRPLVNPTFHVMSKGLGASYAFRSEILSYFGSKLSECFSDSGSRRFSASDLSLTGIKPSISLRDLFLITPKWDRSLTKSLDISFDSEGSLVVRKYSDKEHKFLVGESVIPASSVVNCALEETLLGLKYNRCYVVNSSKVPRHCWRCWEKIGLRVPFHPETRQTSITLPRYYRQWLVSPLSSALRQAAARRLYPYGPQDVSGAFLSERPTNPNDLEIFETLVSEKIRLQASEARLRRSAQNFFCRASNRYFLD